MKKSLILLSALLLAVAGGSWLGSLIGISHVDQSRESASRRPEFRKGGAQADEDLAFTEDGGGAELQRPESARRQSQTLSMPPEDALRLAYDRARCTVVGVSHENQPKGLSAEQLRQLEVSREGARCVGTDEYSIYELAEHAAASGSVQAQVDFPGLAALDFNREEVASDPERIRKYKADSLKYLSLAAKAGNRDALIRLSENYRSGLFTKKDPTKAYAYAYAYSLVENNEVSRLRLNQLGKSL